MLPDRQSDPCSKTGNVAHGGGSVHVCGGISHVRSGSDVTVAVYRRVLEDHLVPHGRTWYRNNWLLADDNARPHLDCVVDAYLYEWSWFGGIGPSGLVLRLSGTLVSIYHTNVYTMLSPAKRCCLLGLPIN